MFCATLAGRDPGCLCRLRPVPPPGVSASAWAARFLQRGDTMKRITLPLHRHRSGGHQVRRAKDVPVPDGQPAEREYPPGHFLALVRLHNWPPRFEPQYQRTREFELSLISRQVRESLQARGITGTILGLTPKADASQQMRRMVLGVKP